MIAFLGTGLMGAAFVRAFLARGEVVVAWNRTLSRAQPLAEDGARVASDPEDAVRGAQRVHISLLDDAAVDDVLARVIPALEPGAVIVDHSTTAPAHTRARARKLAERKIEFLHAPVFMGPGNARNATGLMLVAGQEAVFHRLRPELERMTGKVRYLGDRPDIAAAYKLFGNMEIMFVVSGVADIYALAHGLGIDARDAHSVFDDFDPGTQITVRGKRMAEQEFDPLFELSAARKDVRLMLETAHETGVSLHVLPAIAHRFDDVIARGHGDDDLGSIAATDAR